MESQSRHLTVRPLRSPRAAALAGIVFALLLGTVIILFQRTVPHDITSTDTAWLARSTRSISLALAFIPVAGIAFLWFMGVIRDRLGHVEDQFLSTVFFGSGLLFLAMLFVWAAIIGAVLISFNSETATLMESGIYLFSRILMDQIVGIYALRMAGVFVFSLGTIWMRTGAMPRWLAITTWAVAIVLWTTAGALLWTRLIFPAWVVLISSYYLYKNPTGGQAPAV